MEQDGIINRRAGQASRIKTNSWSHKNRVGIQVRHSMCQCY